ncbi:CGNR zinc finger domain-containing protein [Leifsonia sp. F6_8S_P_1B]|uniref:CGNR zinc finger domain-containing protein n=1 Tax=Leifsonia williamsii TaxID=3035919 RepID=A0ABT8KGZ3_9MICO|nr:CGNR zinc finger domain-containing protein [Leifsonia williamsii]MDN4616258.1 CGNR zinc finger domain-containing protein [Leifsonia williamsii]
MATDSILPRGTGQLLDTGDGAPWWFDSGSLALDFAYTGEEAVGGISAPAVTDPEGLNAWLTERFPEVAPTAGERELRDAGTLRAAIGRLARSASRGEPLAPDDVDVVNLFAATPDIPPVLAGGGRQAGRTNARPHQALGSIARDAVRLFGPEVGGRIRECAADDCELVYLDTSRSSNRRWCSMQRCGNRAKVRAHRARASRVAG